MKTSRVKAVAVAIVVGVVLAPAVAYAAAGFDDVSDSNTFVDDIAWMAETEVTLGCDDSNFCPSDVVTREQMSAFMHRLAEYFGETAYEGTVDDLNTLDATAVSSDTAETVASLTLPEGDYTVVANWNANSHGTDSARFLCELDTGTSTASSISTVGSEPEGAAQQSMSATTVATIAEGGSDVTLACWTEGLVGDDPSASSIHIVATPVAEVSSSDATPT